MQLRPGIANEINIKTHTHNTIHTNGIGTLENSLEASWKVIYIIIIQSCDISPRYLFRRKEGKYIQTPVCKYFNSFINNSYKLKKSRMINLRMDKNILVYPCSVMPAKSLQLCLTLCDPVDCNPPGSPVHGILQESILKWVDIPFSMGSFWPKNRTHISWPGRQVIYHWPIYIWSSLEIYVYISRKKIDFLQHLYFRHLGATINIPF